MQHAGDEAPDIVFRLFRRGRIAASRYAGHHAGAERGRKRGRILERFTRVEHAKLPCDGIDFPVAAVAGGRAVGMRHQAQERAVEIVLRAA